MTTSPEALRAEVRGWLAVTYKRSEHHRDFGQMVWATLDFIHGHGPESESALIRLVGLCRLPNGRVAILTRVFGQLLASCAHQDHGNASVGAKRSKIGRSNLNNSLKISGFVKLTGPRENAEARAELRRKVGTMPQQEARNWSIRIEPRCNAPVIDSADNVLRAAPHRESEPQPVPADGLFNFGFDSGWDPFAHAGEEWPPFW